MSRASGRKLSISRLQGAAKRLLKLRGFTFEARSFGEGRITLWRKKLQSSKEAGGEARRLVIIPGFGDTPLSWLPVTALLPLQNPLRAGAQAPTELVLLEPAGYIGSLDGPRAIATVDEITAAVAALLGELQPELLVGHSMGGFLAAHYASEPGLPRPRALALFCPAGFGLGGEHQRRWEALLGEIAQGEVDGFLEGAIGPAPKNPVFAAARRFVTDEFREFLLREESLSILTTFKAHHEMNGRARRIEVPTTLVWGSKDRLIPFAAFELWDAELRRGGPTRQIHARVLKGRGHGLQLEAPLAVARAIATAWNREGA